jgi:hypothetical protein
LTVIIPIVIYHGDEGWKMRRVSDYFEGIDEHLERFIPNFGYHFTNISGYSNEKLIAMGIGKLLNVFLAMKYVRDKEYIKNNFSSLFIYAEQYLVGEESANFLRTIIVYLFKNSDIRGTTWSNEKIAQIAGVTPTFVQYIRDKK